MKIFNKLQNHESEFEEVTCGGIMTRIFIRPHLMKQNSSCKKQINHATKKYESLDQLSFLVYLSEARFFTNKQPQRIPQK